MNVNAPWRAVGPDPLQLPLPVELPAADFLQPPVHIVAAARAVDWVGLVLPLTMIWDVLSAYPVVAIDPSSWASRLHSGIGPHRDAIDLDMWENWPANLNYGPPPSPVSLCGFVVERRCSVSLPKARWLRRFAPALAVADRPSRWAQLTADAEGVGLARRADDGSVQVVAPPGDHEPTAPPVAHRAVREELFAGLVKWSSGQYGVATTPAAAPWR